MRRSKLGRTSALLVATGFSVVLLAGCHHQNDSAAAPGSISKSALNPTMTPSEVAAQQAQAMAATANQRAALAATYAAHGQKPPATLGQ